MNDNIKIEDLFETYMHLSNPKSISYIENNREEINLELLHLIIAHQMLNKGDNKEALLYIKNFIKNKKLN